MYKLLALTVPNILIEGPSSDSDDSYESVYYTPRDTYTLTNTEDLIEIKTNDILKLIVIEGLLCPLNFCCWMWE